LYVNSREISFIMSDCLWVVGVPWYQAVGEVDSWLVPACLVFYLSESKFGDDADSRVSVGNTNHNDCWRVRVGSPRTTTTNGVTSKAKVCKYIYIVHVAHCGMEVCLSAHQDGAGADNSGSECPTVAHTRVGR